ncbi:MAG: 30S ribosome-binding factor RbfA [Pirellulales bacterium]
MTSRRVAKMSQAVREVVSMAILAEIKDPRVHDVTVTHVDVAPDLRSAKVHVSVMGDDKQQKLCIYGLESAAGFLQRKVGDRIETRYTPRLSFELDMGVKKSIEMARILKEVLPPEPADDAIADDAIADDASADGEQLDYDEVVEGDGDAMANEAMANEAMANEAMESGDDEPGEGNEPKDGVLRGGTPDDGATDGGKTNEV